MLNWIIANLATILICAVLILIITLIAVHVVRDRKRGKTSCGNCSGCAMYGSCHHKH